jgi:hypothetical protein
VDVSFCLGLLLGMAGTALFFLPWLGRLDKELDEMTSHYNELFEAAKEAFDLPPRLGPKERRR